MSANPFRDSANSGNTDSHRTVWTPADQNRLDELVARKAKVEEAGKADVFVSMEAFFNDYDIEHKKELIDYLAQNAQPIRDALKAFDGRRE